MAAKSSLTFSAVLADVSKNSSPASFAYASASAVAMTRLSGLSVTRSSLLPASAMMMFSLACRWSSLTHAFALSSDDCHKVSESAYRGMSSGARTSYRLSDIIDNDGAICVPVVHWSQ